MPYDYKMTIMRATVVPSNPLPIYIFIKLGVFYTNAYTCDLTRKVTYKMRRYSIIIDELFSAINVSEEVSESFSRVAYIYIYIYINDLADISFSGP